MLPYAVYSCNHVGDGEGRDPSKKYVIGLYCIWFYFYVICNCMLLYAVYSCRHVGDAEGRDPSEKYMHIGRFGSLCRRLIKLP